MPIRFLTSRKRTARKKNRNNNTSRKRGNRTVHRATPSLSPPRKVYRKTPKVSAPTSAFAFTKEMSFSPAPAPAPAPAPVKNGSAIVYGKIYAEWCGACKALAPTWEKVKILVGDKSVEFSAEDVELEGRSAEFQKAYNVPLPPVNGYPTIFKLRAKGGTPEFYEDERSVEKLVEWILK
jgi:thiol-disulfide isomerase/thioredoxin